jgi:hypothetical protein
LNSTFNGHNSHPINVFTAAGAGTGGTLNATIQGNVIGTQATIDSGSKIGNGMRLIVQGGAAGHIKVNTNTIHQIPTGRGIEAIGRNGAGGASFIITNNTVTQPTGTNVDVCGTNTLCPSAPIFVQANAISVANSVCAVVSGNTAYNPLVIAGGGEFSAFLSQANGATFNYEGSGAALASLTAANPGCVTKSVTGTVNVVSAGTCATSAPLRSDRGRRAEPERGAHSARRCGQGLSGTEERQAPGSSDFSPCGPYELPHRRKAELVAHADRNCS